MIEALLEKMQPISLDEMQDIRLMDRYDLKYVTSIDLLPKLLEIAAPYYKVQTVKGARISPYCTQYLDTPDLQMFLMHQNGKLNREKVRIRSYVDSNLSFLEIKSKNNKGKTTKIRVPVSTSHLDSISDLKEEKQFLEENSIFGNQELEPMLANSFKRITLVNNEQTERVTIDFDLSFHNYQTGENKAAENLLILEVKQEGVAYSHLKELLDQMRIKQQSFSKYCMGTVLTNPYIKYNRFKRKWSLINKLTH